MMIPEINQIVPPMIPVMQRDENNNSSQVVLQLEPLRDGHEAPNLVIKIPSGAPEPTTRYTFKDRMKLVFAGWATTLFFLSQLKSYSKKNPDYKDMMERAGVVLMLSFASWVVFLILYQTTRDAGRSIVSRALVYGGVYGGAVLALGVTFLTLYIPTDSHTPFFKYLTIAIIGFLVLSEIFLWVKKMRSHRVVDRLSTTATRQSNSGAGFWQKVVNVGGAFWQKVKPVRRGDPEGMELLGRGGGSAVEMV